MINPRTVERLVSVGREMQASTEIFIGAVENGDYELAVVTLLQVGEAAELDIAGVGVGHWMLATMHALQQSKMPPSLDDWLATMKGPAFRRWQDAMDAHGVGPKAAAERMRDEFGIRDGAWQASPED